VKKKLVRKTINNVISIVQGQNNFFTKQTEKQKKDRSQDKSSESKKQGKT